MDERQCGRAERVPQLCSQRRRSAVPPAKFELVINLKIAKAFGLEICASVKISLCNFDHESDRTPMTKSSPTHVRCGSRLCENPIDAMVPLLNRGGMMKGFVQGADRQQTTLLPECLDDWVGESNPVRAVDVFVDALELRELGFDGAEHQSVAYEGADVRTVRSQLAAIAQVAKAALGSEDLDGVADRGYSK